MDYDKYKPDYSKLSINNATSTAVAEEVRAGALQVPPEYLTDTRAWINEEANRRRQLNRQAMYAEQAERRALFYSDLEEELAITHWSHELKKQLYDLLDEPNDLTETTVYQAEELVSFAKSAMSKILEQTYAQKY